MASLSFANALRGAMQGTNRVKESRLEMMLKQLMAEQEFQRQKQLVSHRLDEQARVTREEEERLEAKRRADLEARFPKLVGAPPSRLEERLASHSARRESRIGEKLEAEQGGETVEERRLRLQKERETKAQQEADESASLVDQRRASASKSRSDQAFTDLQRSQATGPPTNSQLATIETYRRSIGIEGMPLPTSLMEAEVEIENLKAAHDSLVKAVGEGGKDTVADGFFKTFPAQFNKYMEPGEHVDMSAAAITQGIIGPLTGLDFKTETSWMGLKRNYPEDLPESIRALQSGDVLDLQKKETLIAMSGNPVVQGAIDRKFAPGSANAYTLYSSIADNLAQAMAAGMSYGNPPAASFREMETAIQIAIANSPPGTPWQDVLESADEIFAAKVLGPLQKGQ